MNSENLLNPQSKIYTVSEITASIKGVLKEAFPSIYVQGEISDFKIASSGHAYLTLKDDKAIINCTLFKNILQAVKFKLETGLQVIVSGPVNVYEPRGAYSLNIKNIIPEGKGALQLAFEQLKARLEKEGLFNDEHKKPLPEYPGKIGVITSLQGAALRDILNIINRRFPDVHIYIYPAVVQGDTAAKTLVKGIKVLNKFFPVDVIILGRGGGSMEDLWAFNEEIVARAVFESDIPVISAVGHEVDYTISDFVADLRVPTPSAAAEIAVKNKEDIYRNIETFQFKIHNFMEDTLNKYRMNYDASFEKFKGISRDILRTKINRFDLLFQEFIQNGKLRFTNENTRFNNLLRSFKQASRNRIKLENNRFQNLANKIALLNPFLILERGYSITYKLPDNKIIKDSGTVNKDDQVRIKLHKGEIKARVVEK